MGRKNSRLRATVLHDAAKAVQAQFRRWDVQSVVGADLAWYLLLDYPGAIKQWKLDIYIQGYRGSMLSLARSLSAIDTRFAILSGTATVTHAHNSWTCDITLISAKWPHHIIVKDIACLPFKYLLFLRMKVYPTIASTTELEHRMFEDVDASKAYLASTKSISPGQVPSQDQVAFDILFESLCATVPDAKETFHALRIFPSRLDVSDPTMINLTTADDVWDTRPKSSPPSPSPFPPKVSTLLAVSTPASPVIPTRGFRAVVFRAAKEVTRIFREAECTFAIMGSAACYLYGNKRLPNDVDILISSHTCDVESLKELLVTKNPRCFYLVNAKTPGATWKVLWYHDRSSNGKLEKTKVDILKPGILQLPMIFSEAIVDKQGLPVVPLSILLLHKLKGWKDNMESTEQRLRSKHDADVGDIGSLLRIVLEGMTMQERKNSTYWKRFALERFDEEFRDETEYRVRLFCWRFPEYRDMWRKLGW
ncbi:uncharacterized protein EV420DRAFT_1316433 [Desarmillaria tabescens]|uniref:Uncharacterized protein n=1 Tax=Armillaria tabescens TaxID=1929756 RepID=A0AA39JBG9_ARMTA|nr:uncharacterized protein EV420DRAFT_1316433 [Desarmillaria tabescens]KAK0438731.1 hypothetical protein EV420DRAFT_1316433 [Desarmillaria tabescens]